MKKKFYRKIRLGLSIAICLLFIAVTFSSATMKPATIQVNETNTTQLKNPLRLSLPFFRFFYRDWNWWDNTPNMFNINIGNVGIGTNAPLAKLDVSGNIAINGKEIINKSGIWVGDPSGLQGPPGPQGPEGSMRPVVIGKWEQTQTREGAGNYTWDIQIFNTNTTCLGWMAGQDHITILKSGYYQINVNVRMLVIQAFYFYVEIKKNEQIVCHCNCSYGIGWHYYDQHFSDIEYFNVNDNVYVSINATHPEKVDRYGGDAWSTMSIVRLN